MGQEWTFSSRPHTGQSREQVVARIGKFYTNTATKRQGRQFESFQETGIAIRYQGMIGYDFTASPPTLSPLLLLPASTKTGSLVHSLPAWATLDSCSRRSPRNRPGPSATSSASPNCLWQKTSTTSTSPTRPSMNLSCSFALGRQDVSFIARSGAMAKKAGANLRALPVVIQPILL